MERSRAYFELTSGFSRISERGPSHALADARRIIDAAEKKAGEIVQLLDIAAMDLASSGAIAVPGGSGAPDPTVAEAGAAVYAC